jgi:hypothetical protein
MRLRQVFFTIPIIAALSFALSAEGGRIIDATHYRAKNGVIECLQVRPLEWGGTFAFLARDAEVEAPDAGGSILISGGWDHYAMFGIDGELVEGYVLGELSLEVQGREIAVSAYSFGEGGNSGRFLRQTEGGCSLPRFGRSGLRFHGRAGSLPREPGLGRGRGRSRRSGDRYPRGEGPGVGMRPRLRKRRNARFRETQVRSQGADRPHRERRA